MTVKAMAEVLDEHIQSARNRRCSCGWRGDVSKSIIDPENIHWQHRQHVAEALSAAGYGLVADAKREAWDEGKDAVWTFMSNQDPRRERPTNPYREASNDDQ